MSNPQGPSHNPADPPAWGQQPSGGWGQPAPDGAAPDDERTQTVDPRTWAPEGAPPQQQPQYGAPPAQQPYGGQPYGGQQYGGQQYGGQQYSGQPYGNQPQQGPQPTQQFPGAQQQPYPGQQGWPQQQGPQQQGPQQQGPQPTQQWGGQQPDGGWGPGYPPLPATPPRSGRSKLLLILGGVGVLIVAAVLVLGFVTPGFFVSKVFDTAAVQTGVQKTLTDSYGIQGVTGVTCGQNIAVTAGNTFTCDATIAGKPARIPVKITSNAGDYEVGRPA